jgi:hypothetical protein
VRDIAHVLLDVEARRHRPNGRYRWMYGTVLVGYAALVVALGVVVDAVLALTPIASIATSLAAAFILWIADRRLVSPRLERWNRRQYIRLLQYELSACAITLAKIKSVQVGIDAMADYTGVSHLPLLNPAGGPPARSGGLGRGERGASADERTEHGAAERRRVRAAHPLSADRVGRCPRSCRQPPGTHG